MSDRMMAAFGRCLGRWRRLVSVAATGWTLAATSPVLATVYNFAYDELGRLSGVVDEASNTATYAYDAAGNIIAIGRGSGAVSLMSFSPRSGPSGTTVTISGAGFAATASQNAVQFNGVAAAISSATTTQLVVQVPAGATTGPISVMSPNGSATSAASFTITQSAAPSISGFSPTIGTPGEAVTVSGANFQTTSNWNNLTFNTRPASVSAATATTLTSAVPAASTSGRLTVTTPYGQATSTQDFLVPPGTHTAADVDVTGRMAIGASQTVTMSTANKVGLILFDGTAGQRVSIGTTSSSFGSCQNGRLQLLNLDGSSAGTTSLCNNELLGAVTLPKTATYSIVVSPMSGDTGSVTFSLYNVPPDATGTISASGSAVTLTTTTPGQNGSLTFSGAAGQRISLTTSQNTIGCYYLGILNPDGSSLFSPYLACNSFFVEPLILPATGTYTITLGHYGKAVGSLKFNLYNVPPDVTGTITAGGPPVTLTTTVPGQDGSLIFSGTGGQRISLVTSQNGIGYYYLSILNPDGTVLYPSYGAWGGLFVEPLSLPVTGTYTIVMKHWGSGTGSLTFSLYNVPANAAGTITIGGAPVTLTTTAPGQDGSLTFSVSSGQNVTLTTSQNTIGWHYLAVLKPDGTTLYPYTGYASNASVGPLTLSMTGTYTIMLRHWGTGTGSLTFTLSP
ncbi:IPT/TIG domain-containing protein [Cupriavidus sp. H39]|uniref:IPT/TIG domain-containing protein n=1 Tax=Cupriavidus sp. H39 TaxID=3401635 RepID=UPI003CFE6BF2